VIERSVFSTDVDGYQQQFDNRGHPINEDTIRSDRRMRRAQNEVLQVVGVTKSKHHQNQQLARRHSLSTQELVDKVHLENVVGLFANGLIRFPLELSTWWITSFRARLCTFRSYLEPGLMHSLLSGHRLLGRSTFFLSGLDYTLAADEIREFRHWLYPPLSRPISLPLDVTLSWAVTAREKLKDFGLFAIEWPIRVRGNLQALGLIPLQLDRPWHLLLSLLSTSPMIYLNDSSKISSHGTLAIFAALCSSPFVTAYLLEQVRVSLESGIYLLLRSYIPRSDIPDRISTEGAMKDVDMYLGYAPGLGLGLFERWPADGDLPFWSRIKAVFPNTARMFDWIASSRTHTPIIPSERSDLLQASRERYTQLVRINNRLPQPERLPDDQLRREAISHAFSEALIDPRGSSVNIHQWADEIPNDDDDATTTPDTANLQSQIEIARSTGQVASEALSGLTEFSPAVPLETLLEPANISEADMPPASSPSTHEPSEPAPEPGITRAASLPHGLATMTTTRRPMRRPTELDEDISYIASSLRSPTQAADRGAIAPGWGLESHRVTALSTFPAEILARFGSSLITSMILLPFEVYYMRQLAMTFLGSSAEVYIAKSPAALDIASLRPSMDIFSTTTLGLVRKVLLTFAVEAVLKGLMWSASAKLCMWTGRNYFLWGVA
jgi:hypothetical protein